MIKILTYSDSLLQYNEDFDNILIQLYNTMKILTIF